MAGIDTAAAVAQRTAELLDDRTVREELDRARRNSRDAPLALLAVAGGAIATATRLRSST